MQQDGVGEYDVETFVTTGELACIVAVQSYLNSKSLVTLAVPNEKSHYALKPP
jgi:hypothetical protein